MISSRSSINDSSRGTRRYLGKYRGVVINNIDPNGLQRVQVQVSEISPVPLMNWALPCTPVGGPQHGLVTVPPIGSGVWVEFERGGDIDYPIWVGCFWGSSFEVPRRSSSVTNIPFLQSITLQTPLQHSIVISDLPGPLGGIQLTTASEAKIHVTDLGIEIDNGKGASIQMIGPMIRINATQVVINDGALMVTG